MTRNECLDKILAKVSDVPTLPVSVLRVMQMIEDPLCSAADLSRVISADPAMAMKVLKLANSAFYGFRQKIGSIPQAVTLLGFATLKNALLAAAVFDMFQVGGTGFDLPGLWKHSVATASAAKLLAKRIRFPNSEKAFTAGLLHDIGKIMIARALPASVASVLLGLLALDAEAPNACLRAAARAWGSWLRALPLPNPQGSPDGLASDVFDCARAGLGVYALDADSAFLRYACAALAAVPDEDEARTRSWQTVALHAPLLLSLACQLPGASVDFDSLSVTLGWRTFAPDPAAVSFLRVTAPGDQPVSVLPLVCRLNDHLLLLVLAPPTTETVHVLKNGKRPLLRDLLSDTLDSAAPLHLVPDGGWARIGLFTIDP